MGLIGHIIPGAPICNTNRKYEYTEPALLSVHPIPFLYYVYTVNETAGMVQYTCSTQGSQDKWFALTVVIG